VLSGSLGASGAHADISSVSVPKTVFVLLALEASTKDFTWVPNETYETLQQCLDMKKKLATNPAENKDVKGFTRPLKCVRYRSR